MDEPFDLSPQAAAAIIGCHEDTLKRWAADGKVRSFRTPGKHWRFRRSDIEAFLAPADIELPAFRYESVPAQPEDAA